MEQGLIPNCPITKSDILRAEYIFGLNLGYLKGKTTHKMPSKLIINALYYLPEGMLEDHGNVTLSTDIIYINNIPFIVTTSRAIHFGTVKMIKDKRKAIIIRSLQQVFDTYHRRGLKVSHILVDMKFKCITKYMELTGITVNTIPRNKHIPEVEIYIRRIKERTRL